MVSDKELVVQFIFPALNYLWLMIVAVILFKILREFQKFNRTYKLENDRHWDRYLSAKAEKIKRQNEGNKR